MNSLEQARLAINFCDHQMLAVLALRMKAVEEVAVYKKANNLPVRDHDREKNLIRANILVGRNLSLQDHFVESLTQLVIGYSCQIQEGSDVNQLKKA